MAFRERVHQFYQHLLHTTQLVQSLGSRRQDIEAFKSRRVSQSRNRRDLFVMAFAFAFGVFLPLVWTRVWMLFALFVPVGCYALLFIWLLQQIPSP